MPSGRLSVPNLGFRDVTVTRVHLGFVAVTSEDVNRSKRTLYTRIASGSSFTIEIIHSSRDAYRDFNAWMQEFVTRLSNPVNAVAIMRVEVPAIQFVRNAVPTSPLNFGEASKEYVWRQTISFAGASDLITPEDFDYNVLSGANEAYKLLNPVNSSYALASAISVAPGLDGELYDNKGKGPPQ